MFNLRLSRRTLALSLASVGIVAGLALSGGSVEAGECPAGKMKVGAMAPSDAAAAGVTDDVLAALDVHDQIAAIDGYQLRTRMLEIQPGGIVPFHSHEGRPALIYVVSGEVTEYRTNCESPIVHTAGDIATESHDVAHWWQNTGTTVVQLLSSDIVPVE